MNILTLDAFEKIQDKQNLQLIDTRLPDFFELGFIKNSINISLNLSKGKNIGTCINLEKDTLIICKPGTEKESIQHLETFDIAKIIGILPFENEMKSQLKYDMVISISSEELVLDSLHNPKAIILDVRAKEHIKEGKVHNAINIPISSLAHECGHLVKDQETIIYCSKGTTSMLASSYLKKIGFTNIKNVWGGFEHIQKEPKAIITKA